MEVSPLAARRLAALLEKRTGQGISGGRRWRLDTALQPVMRRFNLPNLEALAARAGEADTGGDAVLAEAVVEALLNHETSFFRDRATFTMLREQLLPALAEARAAKRRLRIWSAGCATGQETHSLAMLLADNAEAWAGWTVDLVGTDVSAAAVATARAARYTQFEVQRGLGITELLRHFDADGDQWRLRAEVAQRSRFSVHSLLGPPPPGPFDLILCRNVLLYFNEERRAQVFARLAEALAPGGALVLGAGETVLGQTDAFRPDHAIRSCYRRTSAQSAGAERSIRAMPNAA